MSGPTDETVRVVSRREAMQGTGLVLGSLVASGSLTDTVLAQSGGPSDEISGTVEDESGAVQGATVAAVPHDTSLNALSTTTDANGEYIFEQTDLHDDTNLYHVIARDGSEAAPRRGQQNYPFIAAEGPDAIPDSAIHRWRKDEGSGSSFGDGIGNADASISGATWVPENDVQGGYWLDFDGMDDEATVSSNRTDPGDTGSISTTVQIDDKGAVDEFIYIWTHLGTDADNRLMLMVDREEEPGGNPTTGEFAVSLGDGYNMPAGVVPDTGQKYRFGVGWDSGSYAVYLDSSQIATGSYGSTISLTADAWYWGLLEGSDYGDIKVDDTILYDDQLTSNEWQQDYDVQPWS